MNNKQFVSFTKAQWSELEKFGRNAEGAQTAFGTFYENLDKKAVKQVDGEDCTRYIEVKALTNACAIFNDSDDNAAILSLDAVNKLINLMVGGRQFEFKQFTLVKNSKTLEALAQCTQYVKLLPPTLDDRKAKNACEKIIAEVHIDSVMKQKFCKIEALRKYFNTIDKKVRTKRIESQKNEVTKRFEVLKTSLKKVESTKIAVQNWNKEITSIIASFFKDNKKNEYIIHEQFHTLCENELTVLRGEIDVIVNEKFTPQKCREMSMIKAETETETETQKPYSEEIKHITDAIDTFCTETVLFQLQKKYKNKKNCIINIPEMCLEFREHKLYLSYMPLEAVKVINGDKNEDKNDSKDGNANDTLTVVDVTDNRVDSLLVRILAFDLAATVLGGSIGYYACTAFNLYFQTEIIGATITIIATTATACLALVAALLYQYRDTGQSKE